MSWSPGFRLALVPAGILLLYLAAALTTLHAWQEAGVVLTGDEPHYLVIARGILIDHTLEQSVPYREAFEQGLFFGGTVAEPPTPANTHAYLGPHGLFNIHNFGLPLLVAVPYGVGELVAASGAGGAAGAAEVGGVIGVKVFLVLVGGAGLFLLWKISAVFLRSTTVRAVSVGAVGLGMPLLPGANQIFPDIPAGVLCLVGLYGLLTIGRRRPVWQEVLLGVAVGYLPLLQIKFALPAAVLAAALGVAVARRERGRARARVAAEQERGRVREPERGWAWARAAAEQERGRVREPERGRAWARAAAVVAPLVVLLGILFAYNLYAFSNLTGPYDAGAFQAGPKALMAFVGLAIDQNQGFLFQNPIAFAGLVGVGLMFAWRRGFTVVWALVFFALVVPNALLANEYGGYSLNGRFEWAAALVFGVATLFALGRLEAGGRRALWAVVCGAGLAVSAAFWVFVTFSPTFLEFGGRLLYRQDPPPWLLDYSVFFFPVQNTLPALYDTGWAFGFAPNLAWAAVLLVLLAAGFARGIRCRLRRRLWMPVVAALSAAVLVSGLLADPPTPPREYAVSELTVLQGTLGAAGAAGAGGAGGAAGVSVSAATGQVPGPVTEGPITLLRAGTYTVSLTYSSTAPRSVVVGSWQADPAHDAPPPTAELTGTAGAEATVSQTVVLTNIVPATLQARTSWNGTGQLTVLGATYTLDR